MKFAHILKYFVIWQLALLLIASLSAKLLPLRGTFVGEGTAVYNTNPLLSQPYSLFYHLSQKLRSFWSSHF